MTWIMLILGVVLGSVVTGTYLTNPFNRLTIIRRPYRVKFTDGVADIVNENHRLVVRQAWLWRMFGFVKNGLHILSSRYLSSPPSESKTVNGIIADIHRLRYDPSKLLLISGDHFSALSVRNLGVFYYPMLDTRIGLGREDWQDRQAVYLQTVAYALGVFDKYPVPKTTIVPIGKYHATGLNIYAYPPDTVYSLLYALAALQGKELAAPEAYAPETYRLGTVTVAADLLEEYGDTLAKLYLHYRHTVFDGQAGLIRTDIHLSGAKDITRRQGAFYDNVVFWKTTALAMDAGIIQENRQFLDDLKRRILDAFWLEDQGYFLEDQSDESIAHHYYSSDWLIVLVTGFLDPANPQERPYFERCVQYIRSKGIDHPMPLKYHHDTRAHRQFFFVRIAVASYGGNAIWSFWGMEYIKLLLMLYKHTGNPDYLKQADKHIASYRKAMLRNGGFPEVYDSQGKFLETWLYRSVRQTGWVIGFEQARAMRKALDV